MSIDAPIRVAHPVFNSMSEANTFAVCFLRLDRFSIHYVNPEFLSDDQEVGYAIESGGKLYFNGENVWISMKLANTVQMVMDLN